MTDETSFHGKSPQRLFLSLTIRSGKPRAHRRSPLFRCSSSPSYVSSVRPLTSSLVGMLVVLGLSQTPVSFLSGGSVWIASVSSEGRRFWFCAVRAVGFCSWVMTARVSAWPDLCFREWYQAYLTNLRHLTQVCSGLHSLLLGLKGLGSGFLTKF